MRKKPQKRFPVLSLIILSVLVVSSAIAFRFIPFTVSALQEVAGPLVMQVPVGGNGFAKFGLINDGNETITVTLRVDGNASKYLSFPPTVTLEPNKLVYADITANIPPNYDTSSGRNITGQIYALQVSSLGLAQINIQMAKSVVISVVGQSIDRASTGVIIPLYTSPTDSTWTTVINAKTAHPSVPIIAIINPINGVGPSIDTNYVTGIQNLKSAGVIVIGYVSTLYGVRSVATIESEINNYKSWYNVNGIFFDEMSNLPGYETYYSTLNAYAKANGMTLTVGNPGTNTLPSYVGTVDNMIFYETGGVPSLSYLTGWFTGYNKGTWSYLAYGVNSLDTTYELSSANSVGYLYITNDVLGNPWDTLPPYFMNEVATLDIPIPTTTTTTTTTSTTTTTTTIPVQYANIIVSTKGSNNQLAPGFWIESVYDKTDKILVANGLFTPQSIVGKVGHDYAVTVDDYGISYMMYSSVGNFIRNTTARSGTTTFTLQGNTNIDFTLLRCY